MQRRLDPVHADVGEQVVDEGSGCLGGVAAAPVVGMEGVTEIAGAAAPAELDDHVAEDPVRRCGVDDGDGPPRTVDGSIHRCRPGHRLLCALSRVGHLPVLIAGHLGETATLVSSLGIAEAWRPQDQPLRADRFETHDVDRSCERLD